MCVLIILNYWIKKHIFDMWNDLKYEKSKMAIFILYPKMTQKHNSYANTFDRLECSYTLLFSFKKKWSIFTYFFTNCIVLLRCEKQDGCRTKIQKRCNWLRETLTLSLLLKTMFLFPKKPWCSVIHFSLCAICI